jgi:hypothetical protein
MKRPLVKRSSTVFSKKLPKNWRMLICEELKKQGITINPQTVTDVLSGKNQKLDLLENIIRIRQEISKSHAERLKKRHALIKS